MTVAVEATSVDDHGIVVEDWGRSQPWVG